MNKLYIKTENEIIPIDETQVQKYNLKAGDVSPYSNYKIVDEKGNDKKEYAKGINKRNHSHDEVMSDGIVFTTSEVLDLARGADSEDVGNLMPE